MHSNASGQHLLTVPRVSTVAESKAFYHYAPHLWNRLLQPLRNHPFSQPPSSAQSDVQTLTQSVPSICYPNLPSLKTALKTFLFESPSQSLIP